MAAGLTIMCIDWFRQHFFGISQTHIYFFFSLYRLNGHHVVFGKVLSGMDVVHKIEAEGRQSGEPISKVAIIDSGEMPL